MGLVVVGLGAIGLLFAGRLALAGVPVLAITRTARQAALLDQHGLSLIERDGRTRQVMVAASAALPPDRRVPAALVCVKASATDAAVQALRDRLTDEALIVLCQNGLGGDAAAAAALGTAGARLALAVTGQGATRLGPTTVRHAGDGETLLGYADAPADARLVALADRLTAAGIASRAVDDIRPAQWRKLAANAAINPLTALLRVTNGALLARSESRALLRALAVETAAVARAEGVALADEEAVALAEAVARQTAGNVSSMRQDIEAGRPTEIDWICGAVVARATRHGLAAPVNATMTALIHLLEARQEDGGA